MPELPDIYIWDDTSGKRGPKPRRKTIAWSAELAYAIGLIATDGCLSKDGRHIDLTSKDREQIENLRNCLNLKAKIGQKDNGAGQKSFRVQWSDVTLYNFFLEIGLTPNKSLTMPELAVPDKYFFDFLRGSFDGDGCFYSYFDKRWKSSFMFYVVFTTASREHVIWLRGCLTRFLGVHGHIHIGGIKNPIYTLRFAKKEAFIIIQQMYQDISKVHLSRKRLKIIKALAIVGKSLIKGD
jgi:hypothetical protein